jgi:beta-glucosidase
LGGYSGGCSKAVSPFDGIVNKLGSDKVRFAQGTDIKIKLPLISTEYLIPAGGKPGEHGLKGEYFKQVDCQGEPVLTRIDPILDFNFGKSAPVPELPKDYFSVRWTGKLVAPVSGSYYIGGEFDDAIRLYIDGKKIIDRTNNRNTSSDAVKIELEKGKQYDLLIEYNEQWHVSIMKLGGAAPNPDKFKEAIEAAKRSDVAVVVVGTDESVEKEGVDRADLNLPGDQEDLVKAVLQANPNTIMVMQNGGAMAINWANQHVPAIVEAWYGGEETGNAIADVLFGDYNPAGRLPMTFYESSDDLPSVSDYDIRKGRTYMYPKYKDEKGQTKETKALYPFGFGLSYTQFTYSNLKVFPAQTDANGTISVKIDVKNTGKMLGEEVIQLYVTDKKASVQRPEKQLAAFERVSIAPNQTKTVELVVSTKDLAFWDVNKKTFVVEPGKFKVMIGSSSKDIKASSQFVIK